MSRRILLLVLCSISFLSQAESPSEVQEIASRTEMPLGFTVRLVPSFFYRTYGLEMEYPFNGKSTLGLNALYYTGSGTAKTSSTLTGDGTYAASGFLAELQYKYYFFGLAPTGLYAMLGAGYNSIVYPDGSTRPFVLINSWEDQKEIGESTSSLPNSYIGSVGLGYQLIMIEPHISGNVVIGAQFQTRDIGLSVDFFITPSLGWTF